MTTLAELLVWLEQFPSELYDHEVRILAQDEKGHVVEYEIEGFRTYPRRDEKERHVGDGPSLFIRKVKHNE
jgi:hypothetical protein